MHLLIKYADFFTSVAKTEQLPRTNYPEFAFIGRSNVGKSSLINLLLQRKNLARTSSTPGKTQLINYFLVNKSWFLTDLPGYGYAKVSKKQRDEFRKLIDGYLLSDRKNLLTVFVLVDSRLTPQKSDLAMIRKLGTHGVPLAIVFTKTDKPKQKDLARNINLFKKTLLQEWEELPPIFKTSAVKKKGREQILQYISRNIELYKNYLKNEKNESLYISS